MNFNILKIVKEKWHLSYRWKTILMTMDFSSETIRDQKKVAQHFANTERKDQPESHILCMISVYE